MNAFCCCVQELEEVPAPPAPESSGQPGPAAPAGAAAPFYALGVAEVGPAAADLAAAAPEEASPALLTLSAAGSPAPVAPDEAASSIQPLRLHFQSSAENSSAPSPAVAAPQQPQPASASASAAPATSGLTTVSRSPPRMPYAQWAVAGADTATFTASVDDGSSQGLGGGSPLADGQPAFSGIAATRSSAFSPSESLGLSQATFAAGGRGRDTPEGARSVSQPTPPGLGSGLSFRAAGLWSNPVFDDEDADAVGHHGPSATPSPISQHVISGPIPGEASADAASPYGAAALSPGLSLASHLPAPVPFAIWEGEAAGADEAGFAFGTAWPAGGLAGSAAEGPASSPIIGFQQLPAYFSGSTPGAASSDGPAFGGGEGPAAQDSPPSFGGGSLSAASRDGSSAPPSPGLGDLSVSAAAETPGTASVVSGRLAPQGPANSGSRSADALQVLQATGTPEPAAEEQQQEEALTPGFEVSSLAAMPCVCCCCGDCTAGACVLPWLLVTGGC